MVIVEKSQNNYKVVTELPQSNYKWLWRECERLYGSGGKYQVNMVNIEWGRVKRANEE